jgi:hypothetical protein
MTESNRAGAVCLRALIVALALMPATTVFAQSRNGDPRSPGGRPLLAPITEQELKEATRAATDRSLADERESLQRDESWLQGEYKKLVNEVQGIGRRRVEVASRLATWRCPAGLTVEDCYAHPPVHPEAAAFRAWYNSEVDRLDSRLRRVTIAKRRLDDFRRSLESRRRDYEMALKDRKDPGARKSKRSPSEGLFIDESAPRVR